METTLNTTHHETEKRWGNFTIWQQLLAVGSEVGRARSSEERDDKDGKRRALERAMELLDFTIADPRWRNHRLAELLRARELVAGHFDGSDAYDSTLADLENYFNDYGWLNKKK